MGADTFAQMRPAAPVPAAGNRAPHGVRGGGGGEAEPRAFDLPLSIDRMGGSDGFFMTTPHRDRWTRVVARYGVAVTAVAIAVGVRLAMHQIVPLRSPFLLLFAAVMLSAAYGGLGPGVLATVLASLASDVFLAGWPSEQSAWRISDHAQVGLFFLEGLFLSLLGAMLHHARHSAETADAAARKLEQRILEISEGERRRIGHDLHDGLGQHLTGIALLAKGLRKRLSDMGIVESEQAAQIAQLVNESIGWTRDLARGLSPVALDAGGLPPALEELAASATGLMRINCSVEWDGQDVPLDGETSLHLFRIAQEAINNSVKHGAARSVRIDLRTLNERVTMTVTDDGRGISSTTRSQPGIGLQIMQYRAKMIGATIELTGDTRKPGTIVRCSVPAGSPRKEESE